MASSTLRIRVTPRAGRDALAGIGEGVLRVRVAAAPADGAANRAVIRLVADALQVPPSRVAIRAGATSRCKTLEIDGLAPDALSSRLAALDAETRR